MSCGAGKRSVSLVNNKQLRSNSDGTAKTYWSEDLGFTEAALYVRAAVGYASTGASVRFIGRYSVDGETFYMCGNGTDGYIDSAAVTAAGVTSFWYLGGEGEHALHFQIGIEVDNTSGSFEASITLSAEVEFGPIEVTSVSLAPTAGTLVNSTNAAVVPGASTISTYGCSKLRIEVKFSADPAQVVTFYLATGPTVADIYPDLQNPLVMPNATARQASFVVEAPDKYSTVYYSVGTTTTGSISSVRIVRIP